ncbi:hypothetical protein PANDA_012277, partial [Ailuropoda melanoleuca]
GKTWWQLQVVVHRIRMNVKSLEKVCTDLIRGSKAKNPSVKGPVRMPSKTVRITARKTASAEGSKTWDLCQVRTHKPLKD